MNISFAKLLIVICLVCLSGCATSGLFTPMDRQDIGLEIAYQVLHYADLGQTLDIEKNQDKFYETNPILDRHFNKKFIWGYFIGTSALHLGLVKAIPKKWRPFFQAGSIALEAGVVTNNYTLGLKCRW